MEIKIKDKLLMNGRFGAIKNFKIIYQRIYEKLSTKSSDMSNLKSVPYEIEEYRINVLEFERKQAQAIADAQRIHNCTM